MSNWEHWMIPKTKNPVIHLPAEPPRMFIEENNTEQSQADKFLDFKFEPMYEVIDVEKWHDKLFESVSDYHERIFTITNEPIVFKNGKFPNEGLEIEETDAWHDRMMELKDVPPMFKTFDVSAYHERLFESEEDYHEKLFEQNDDYVKLYRYVFGDFGEMTEEESARAAN